jgi:uncharacterized repeat protein (TIGR01451 family)
LRDFWVVKLDKNGVIQWQNTYENTFDEDAQSIILTSDGGYALCGTANPASGSDNIIIFKISGTGALQWQKQIGGTGVDQGRQIAETSDGGFVITGFTGGTANGDFTGQTNHGGKDLFVVKINSTGTLLWTKLFGGTRDEEGRFIRQLSDGNILVGGEAASVDGDVTGNHSTLFRADFWVLKLTPAGNIIWKNCYGSTGVESAYNAFENDNRYFLIGETVTTTNAGNVSGLHDANEIWMVVLDPAGNLLRQKIIGGTSLIDKGRDIALTLDNNIIIGGFTGANDGDFHDNHGSDDYALIKLDTLGNILWTRLFGGPGGDNAYSVAVNADSTYSLLGNTLTPGGDVSQIYAPGQYDLWLVNCKDISYLGDLAALSNVTIDLVSQDANAIVGTNSEVEFFINFSFKSTLDTTRGVLKFVKDPRAEFTNNAVRQNLVIGDTLYRPFTAAAHQVNDNEDFYIELKGIPHVNVGDVIKNYAIIEFNNVSPAWLQKSDTLLQTVTKTCILPDLTNTPLASPHGIQWLRTFGGSGFDAGNTQLTAVSDTSFIMATDGYSNDGDMEGAAPETNIHAVKYLTNGTMVWKKEIGGNQDEYTNSMVNSGNGTVIVAGHSNSTDGQFSDNHGETDVLLTKLDNQGNIVWLKTFGGSGADSYPHIRKIRDNQYIILASTRSNNGNVVNPYSNFQDYHPWLFAIDGNGNILWQKVLPDSLGSVDDIQVTADGKFILAGSTQIQDPVTMMHYSPIRIYKTDSTGSIQYIVRDYLDKDFSRSIYSFVINPDSSITFAGNAFPQIHDQSCAGSHGDQEVWVGKISKTGNFLWSKFFGGDGTDGGLSIIPVSGGYLLLGDGDSNNGNATGLHENGDETDGWIIKINENAELQWQKMIGGDEDDYFLSALEMPNHELIIAGNTSSYNNGDIHGSKGDVDAIVLKIGAVNYITGSVFLDANGNHTKDNDEAYFTEGIVKSIKGDLTSSSDIKNGFYANPVDTGSYITSPVVGLNYYTAFPVTHTSQFNTYQKTDTVNFAMVPVGNINDLRITMVPVSAARPGFKALYQVKYENAGTIAIPNGTVKLVKDNRSTFSSATINPAGVVADTIIWSFTNLKPMQTGEIGIEFQLAPPPALNNSDTLKHYIIISPITGDSTPVNNRADIKQPVTGSYDPNDKTESHGNGFEEQMLLNGEYLNYVIRFQNTGNDTAFRVLVRDTLSSRMDWNSFEMISASHPYTLSITDQNKLEWKFDPIILPDSTNNNAASNGYVAFRIKPTSTLVMGDTIANRAGIYFDFNLPVITNKQETIIAPATLSKPTINGLVAEYCRKSQIVTGNITNPQPSNTGVTTTVKLDNTAITVVADGSFSFDLAALTAGNHTVSVRFTLGSTTMLTEFPFHVTEPGVLDLNLSANTTSVTNASQSVIITGVNAAGGSNLRYTYAKDRTFTNILQAEGNNNIVTIDPANLNQGNNWVYGRISANGECYTEETNIDSIQIAVNFVTGVVDVDAPGRSIIIYPVPFNEHLILKGFSPSKKYDVLLVNAQGSQLYSATIKNRDTHEFKTAGLPAGVYIVHLYKNGKKLGAVQVVKQ